MTRFVALLLLAFCTLGSCFLLPREEKLLAPPLVVPPEVTFDEIEVKRGDIINSIEVTAYFQALEERGLYFRYRGGPLRRSSCAVGDEVKMGTILAEIETGSLPIQIRRQDLMIRKAEILLDRLKVLRSDKYQIQLAEIDLELAELQLDELKQTAANATIYAPMDGVVTYKARLGEGDYVNAYQVIIKIGNPNKLSLVYSGNEIHQFRPGMSVDVVVEGTTYPGEVLMTAANVPPDGDPELKKLVIIAVAPFPPVAKRGTQARVVAVLSRKDDITVVPRNVVHTYMGETFVNILKDGVRIERPVDVGIMTNTEAEIIRGVKEGDMVVW